MPPLEPISLYLTELAFPHSPVLNQLFLVILLHENSVVTINNIFKIIIKMLIKFSNSATDNSAAKPGYTAAESNSSTASPQTLRFKMQL